MATLSYGQLVLLCAAAGWSYNPLSPMGSDAQYAAAVAMAESSGRTDATSPNPDGGTNVGLFQLDTPGGAGHGHSVAELKNANLNAAVAYQQWLKDGKSFKKSWATANNGAAAKVLQEQGVLPKADWNGLIGPGAQADAGKGLTNPLSASNPLSAADAAVADVGKAAAWVTTPANWLHVVYVVGGAALVLVGLYVVASPVINGTANTVTKVASNATPVGRAVTAVGAANTRRAARKTTKKG